MAYVHKVTSINKNNMNRSWTMNRSWSNVHAGQQGT